MRARQHIISELQTYEPGYLWRSFAPENLSKTVIFPCILGFGHQGVSTTGQKSTKTGQETKSYK